MMARSRVSGTDEDARGCITSTPPQRVRPRWQMDSCAIWAASVFTVGGLLPRRHTSQRGSAYEYVPYTHRASVMYICALCIERLGVCAYLCTCAWRQQGAVGGTLLFSTSTPRSRKGFAEAYEFQENTRRSTRRLQIVCAYWHKYGVLHDLAPPFGAGLPSVTLRCLVTKGATDRPCVPWQLE